MPFNRLAGRNTFYYLSDEEEPMGGAVIHPNSTTANDLYNFISILVIPTDVPPDIMGTNSSMYNIFFVGSDGEQLISHGKQDIKPGDYRIRAVDSRIRLVVTDECALPRVRSRSVTSRKDAFKNGIRERDGVCVVTGRVAKGAPYGNWAGFEAAHVFPLEQGDEWLHGSGNWPSKITDMEGYDSAAKMNSVQNGMLLYGGEHTRFDSYEFGVDPRAGYKIFEFSMMDDLTGRTLSPSAREMSDHGPNDKGVRDALLLWHFRMCVLANMKGAGEPIWDFDFADGDDVGELLTQDPTGKLHSLALYQQLTQHSLADNAFCSI